MALLEIKGLTAGIEGKEIIHGIDLEINRGEIHAILGPNGAGKSTLNAVLTGKPGYEVTGGSITYNGEDLLKLSPEERSRKGIFLSFQYPVEIPGVSFSSFMKAALDARRKAEGKEPLKAPEFLKMMKEQMALVGMKPEFSKREVNVGFSGGEKKRGEIFQMAMLHPVLSILDETDSGLDVDALKIVAAGVNTLHTPENASIIITHYRKLLEYVRPDIVHILKEGRIVRSGGRELADEVEALGFEKF
ncbi:MAG: Fe-S cluster assembly ATPase SufC [Bacteroidales bacterium]|nr:Fe-S cluster assembly ATPase SufC [Bacteroidales bacterium]